jgi:hypothetical protein
MKYPVEKWLVRVEVMTSRSKLDAKKNRDIIIGLLKQENFIIHETQDESTKINKLYIY